MAQGSRPGLVRALERELVRERALEREPGPEQAPQRQVLGSVREREPVPEWGPERVLQEVGLGLGMAPPAALEKVPRL